MVAGDYKGIQGLQGIARVNWGLQANTRGYMGLQS